MRHIMFMAAAAAALSAGLGQAQAGPLASGPLAAPVPTAALSVQYWGGGWGPPRIYDYDDEPPVYRRRYVVPDDEDILPASEAIAIARSMGYRAISRPRLAGRVWVVETVGGAGQRARVTIHAYSGAPINIRELEPGGPRFPTPPVWSDERPGFGNALRPPVQREGRLDPDGVVRPERPARPAPNITARVVPVPTPRPNIDGDLVPQPPMVPPVPPLAQPPAAETPAAPPPAASLPPRQVDPPAVTPVPPPALSVEPTQPFPPPSAALPPAPTVAPAPPAAMIPEAPVRQIPAPAAALPPTPAPVVPVPGTPAPPAADPVVPPAPAAAAPAAEPAPATETARKPGESEGVLIDGRFLGPNGESLPPAGGPPATSGIRQVAPPASN